MTMTTIECAIAFFGPMIGFLLYEFFLSDKVKAWALRRAGLKS